MSRSITQSAIAIRDLETISDIEPMLRLEKEVWGLADADVTPLTLAVALKAAGSIVLGAFEGRELVGFALAFPSFEQGRIGLHSHMLAVSPSHREYGLGYRLKLAQRERALAIGITHMTWTFDPLRSLNAHLNFSKLGVVSDSYRVNFYGPETSSHLHTNGTDRLWVTWRMADSRVQDRLNGKNGSAEVLDALRHLEPLVRFNGNGKPAEGDLAVSLSRQRIAIEIPRDMDRIEHINKDLAREWRLATRRAFTAALDAGFVVKEFSRSIRGQQGPGAYLLEQPVE
ncbi:MAG TPA: GNAT family N-acetyltransferase [Terriglobales bacterium]|jgi:predicted GNAT superfamily acetyltransferase|nr:GNAT family N-acetyltransferase [Terriglobales bacterium]